MKKLNLVIVDNDDEYLLALSNYLSSKYFSEFKITSISNADYFKEYLDKVQGIDILLINNKYANTIDLKNKFVNTIIFICDEPNNNMNNSIFKYVNADKIYNEIKEIYFKANPTLKNTIGGKDTKITCCYSPLGGCGKTIISIAMLLELREENKEVLYLNLEDIPSTNLFFNCSGRSSISEVLYLLKDRNENLKIKILEYLKKDETGIYYFEPIENVVDYENISGNDIVYFLSLLSQLNKFDHIIIDMSSKFNSVYSQIINSSDMVLTILGQDLNSKRKLDSFLEQQESLDKFIFVLNKYKNDNAKITFPNSLSYENITAKIDFYNVYDNNLNGLDDLKCNNPFTLEIKQLVEKLY